jgi:hypothetical protein
VAKRSFTIGVRYLPALLSAAISVAARGQEIEATPQGHVFSAIVRGPNPPNQITTVSNTGSGSLTYQLTGNQAAWLTVGPRQGTAPSSLTFAVNITGMSAGIYHDTVRVASNDAKTPTKAIPVTLQITDLNSSNPRGIGLPNIANTNVRNPGNASSGTQNQSSGGANTGPPKTSGLIPTRPGVTPAVYEVEFTMTGYAGEFAGAPECKVRLNGFDRMTGLVIGLETGEQDDDMVYYGRLQRETNIDYCLTKGRRNPSDDEKVWCELTLKGWSEENVELTIHSDPGRGGFLKSTTEPGYSSAGISKNSCRQQETWDAANAYANSDDGGGGSPSGQQIDDAKATDPSGKPILFSPDRIPKLRVGTFPPDGGQNGSGGNGWTLRVIRKIQ